MTSVFTVQLMCECGCTHLSSHGCDVKYPAKPAEGSAKELRARAATKGWETLRGTKGRDVCPPCRIAEISAATGARTADGTP